MANLLDINLNRLVVFVAVVETGSITAAAKRLGLAKTVVSAHIQKLEAEIGTHLLVRTTRRLHLTEAGTLFYEACEKILRDTEAAVSQVGSCVQQPRGRLRLSCPVDYAAAVVAPLAAQLCREYPELRVEILSSDQRIDMVAEGIDLAIRIGRLADSSHRAAQIAHFSEWLVAAPELFSGELPQSPEELGQCPFVGLSVLSNPLYWTFTANGVEETRRFNPAIMANTTGAVQAAVLAGAGIAVLPDYAVGEDIAAGRLVRLLPDWKLPGGGIYAVFPATAQRPQKVSVFIEALKKHYAG
ncbi:MULTISPECIES: LysR family transcriptional regulator [unclassified Microbulbifer]|uniref:LysR family transcriptional regulator n=1 Tax=unclassified Microbulbifer TaxID=2619833 RepID=UPI0027E4FFFF|nr:MULTISPECIES: LysR family transcriptional regulator [unclassified Microbulbifer]